jgi:hypothetical protein
MNIYHLFDRTLGEFNMETIPISLQLMDPNFKPIHACTYSETTIAIPKKNGTIRNVIDFRKFNLLLKRHPFPIPNIGESDMIRSIEGFTFASAMDLNNSYYHIKLDADAQMLCTIVFPWNTGKYKYKHKRLPMVIKIAPDVFKMSCVSLSKIWNTLRQSYYLDDLLILTNRNNSFKDHLLKLEMVLERLSFAGMRVIRKM